MILALVLARTLAVTPAHATGYVRFTIPQSVDAGNDGGYDSLRIVDRDGAEVPYALDPTPAVVDSTQVGVSDLGFVPGKYTQAILDFGTSGALHDAVALQISEPTFFERVALATSEDRAHWAIVPSDTPIYRIAQTADEGNQTVSTGPTHARWVRVRVLEPAHAFDITGASAQSSPPPVRLAALTRAQTIAQKDKRTIVNIDLGVPNTGVDALAIESTTGHFSRQISVESPYESTDANGLRSEQWSVVHSDAISRYATGKPNLVVPVQLRAQRFRIVIDNGDDTPLANIAITPLGATHVIVFRGRREQTYRISWGANLAAPQYDLRDQLAHAAWRASANARMAEIVSPISIPAKTQPWLSRIAIPVALGLACVILAIVVLTSLRSRPV